MSRNTSSLVFETGHGGFVLERLMEGMEGAEGVW